MNFFAEFITVVIAHLLAVMSPGPDFLLVARNSLFYSRRSGIYSAVGVGLGILVHVFYSLVGIGFVISRSIVVFNIFKVAAAGYLIYIGYASLRAKDASEDLGASIEIRKMTSYEAFKIGFVTNALNPKAALFFLSLFTLVISPETPVLFKLAYGIEMSVATTLWFSFIAVLFSHKVISLKLKKVQHWAERGMGALLIALGVKLIFTKAQ
jgi:RhtB (resistance to homoserine/threonine) family protein